jgi:hypothetical protein
MSKRWEKWLVIRFILRGNQWIQDSYYNFLYLENKAKEVPKRTSVLRNKCWHVHCCNLTWGRWGYHYALFWPVLLFTWEIVTSSKHGRSWASEEQVFVVLLFCAGKMFGEVAEQALTGPSLAIGTTFPKSLVRAKKRKTAPPFGPFGPSTDGKECR